MTPSRAQLEEHVPWKVSDQVSERMDFVMRLRDGETMSELCREFGISRKTGYKLRDRFDELGPVGLYDQPRVAKRLPHKTDAELAKRVVEARRQHPTWGPKKLRAWLQGRESGVSWPCTSTIGEILKREGLVQPRKRRRNTPPYEAPLEKAHAPHDVWCADFKGQFRLGNGKLCYPLTITDRFTRTILCCEALESTATDSALLVFEKTFREHGLPKVIRTDNGIPFASKGRARSEPAVREVAAPGDLAGEDRARAPRAERATRAHAPRAEAGDHEACGAHAARAAGALRSLRRGVQH